MAYNNYDPSKRDDSYSWSYDPKSAIHDNGNGTYTQGGITLKNNYTTDKITPGMSYAIKQAGGNPNAPKAADEYAEKLMGRIGTKSANGDYILTRDDIAKELSRLGYKVNSSSNDWTGVGGQQFLTGGDVYNQLKDTLNKAGYGNMNIYNGQNIYGSNANAPGSGANYVGNGNGSGNLGYSSYIDSYAQALQQQLDRINEQKKLAAENADREKRQAYVAMRLGQKALGEQNAASGLQDSGYSEQGNIALTADYGNNLNTIGANYQQYLNDLAGTYADTALSGAGTLADLYQQDYQNRLAAQQYADKLAQQQWENQFAEKQYADQLAQQQLQNQLYQRENDLSLAKTRADAAMSLGIWSPEIETVYGVTQAEYQNYLRSQMQPQAYSSYSSGGGSRSRSSSGGSYGGSVKVQTGDDNIEDIYVPTAPVSQARQARLAATTNQAAQNKTVASSKAAESEKSGNWFTNLLNKRDERLQYEDSTDGKAAKLAQNFGLDDATALAIINTADRAGISYGEAYKQYMTEYGNESQKKNAGALAKQVDRYVKRY